MATVIELHRSHAEQHKPAPVAPASPPSQESSPTKTAERDGNSYETAIILAGFPDEQCDAIEKAWMDAHLPAHRLGRWSYVWYSRRAFDIYQVFPETGPEREVYFDVTKIIQSMPDMSKPPDRMRPGR